LLATSLVLASKAGCGNNELISQLKRYSKNIFLVRKLILPRKLYGGYLKNKNILPSF